MRERERERERERKDGFVGYLKSLFENIAQHVAAFLDLFPRSISDIDSSAYYRTFAMNTPSSPPPVK